MKEKEKRESERKKIGEIKGENRRRRRGRGKRKGKTLPRQLQVAGFILSDATASYVLSVLQPTQKFQENCRLLHNQFFFRVGCSLI